jgi:hypothetical protein
MRWKRALALLIPLLILGSLVLAGGALGKW